METETTQITLQYLRDHPNEIFVFGDNKKRIGKKGAAVFRGEPNVYGFITKKRPSGDNDAFYKPSEYRSVYEQEIIKLLDNIRNNKNKTYLISKVGAGLANRYRIWQDIIEPSIKSDLRYYKNVRFLW